MLMSKIGRKIINIPSGVKVDLVAGRLNVQGPKGGLTMDLHAQVEATISGSEVNVTRRHETKLARSLHGTTRALIANMVKGVTEGFNVKLIIEGVGFKAAVQGRELNMNLGYTHPVNLEIPEGLEVKIDKGLITISGSDKQRVGQFAALTRAQRVPDAYKGKGIRYEDERLKLKPGKKAATATAA